MLQPTAQAFLPSCNIATDTCLLICRRDCGAKSLSPCVSNELTWHSQAETYPDWQWGICCREISSIFCLSLPVSFSYIFMPCLFASSKTCWNLSVCIGEGNLCTFRSNLFFWIQGAEKFLWLFTHCDASQFLLHIKCENATWTTWETQDLMVFPPSIKNCLLFIYY